MTLDDEKTIVPEWCSVQDKAAVKGLHAIVEHTGAISHLNCEQLDTLLRRAALAAGATILGSNFHDFGDGLGNTGVLILAESHISIHTWPENNYAAIDIFFCSASRPSGIESIEAALEILRSADKKGVFYYDVITRVVPPKAQKLATRKKVESTVQINQLT